MILLKRVIKGVALICLTCFSFFYTDKVINLLNENDPLMDKIKAKQDNYLIEPVNAIIDNDTIIPGINGKKMDVSKSYDEMKLGGIFREDLIIYNYLYPSDSLYNNKDKYIIKGNGNKKKVALLVILSSRDIDKINNNNITIFLNHKDIDIDNISKLKYNEVYSYGNNGVYNYDLLVNDNTIINRLSNNKSIYCLAKNKDNNVLDVCNKNDMFVVIPNVIGGYFEIKNNITNGSIILLDDINYLNDVIKYINGKGYEIIELSKLLKE